METKKKLLYEPPVMEVFELKVECVLQSTSKRGIYDETNDNPFSEQ